MQKVPLLLLAVTLTAGLTDAAPLVVAVSGQFSSSDVADSLISPSGFFTLSFGLDSNPTPIAGTSDSLGFSVPLGAYSYTLNGIKVAVTVNEVHFDTFANGGLFDLTIGSGLSAAQFVFQGPQAFTGSTTAPAFSTGKFTLANWTFSDPANYDTQTPASAFATVSLAPEPSSLGLFVVMAAVSIAAFRRKFTNSVR